MTTLDALLIIIAITCAICFGFIFYTLANTAGKKVIRYIFDRVGFIILCGMWVCIVVGIVSFILDLNIWWG